MHLVQQAFYSIGQSDECRKYVISFYDFEYQLSFRVIKENDTQQDLTERLSRNYSSVKKGNWLKDWFHESESQQPHDDSYYWFVTNENVNDDSRSGKWSHFKIYFLYITSHFTRRLKQSLPIKVTNLNLQSAKTSNFKPLKI